MVISNILEILRKSAMATVRIKNQWCFIVCFIMVLFSASCTTKMQTVDREVGASQPVSYKEGYKDGCDSGYVASGHPYYKFSKNVIRFNNDSLYKQGWEDGYGVCKSKYDSTQRLLRR